MLQQTLGYIRLFHLWFSQGICPVVELLDHMGFQVALVVKNLPASAGDRRDASLILGLGRSPGGGNGNPPPYSCLENPMDRGAWRTTVHRVTKSPVSLKWLSIAQHSMVILFLGFFFSLFNTRNSPFLLNICSDLLPNFDDKLHPCCCPSS